MDVVCMSYLLNVWANPSKAGATDTVEMAAFLEERSRGPDLQKVN
jgi:hypothetical protein